MIRFFATAIVAAALLCVACANARAQELQGCTSSIRVPFNKYGTSTIEAGRTIWFSSVLESVDAGASSAPLRIDVRNSKITFGNRTDSVAMPDSTIVIDPSATDPARTWSPQAGWSLTYAPTLIPEAFFNGMPFAPAEPFVPGYSGPVTWTATFTASRPDVALRWAWSAATYKTFGINGWLVVKPVTAATSLVQGGDPAGTPERYKQFVVPGAMGSGAPDYTGARSDAAVVHPCLAEQSPPTAPRQPGPQPVRRELPPTTPPAPFSSPVTQAIPFAGGDLQAVDRCYPTDLCAFVTYNSGEQLAIYSEGAPYCEPYVLKFIRTAGARTVYEFSRTLDYDVRKDRAGRDCDRTRVTRLKLDGGRLSLTIVKNRDGTLGLSFAPLSAPGSLQ